MKGTIGERIKAARLAVGMTQQELALRINQRAETIQAAAEKMKTTSEQIEAFEDSRSRPNIGTLGAIARSLNCSFFYLEDDLAEPTTAARNKAEMQSFARQYQEQRERGLDARSTSPEVPYPPNKIFLRPEEIESILECAAKDIVEQAIICPEKLGFPVSVLGNEVRIPRKAFLRWIGEDNREARKQ